MGNQGDGVDHFPRSRAYRLERLRPVAPQRAEFERDEPLLDHAHGGWDLKYSFEPHRVTEAVAGRSQGKQGGGMWLPRKPCVFTFLQEREPEEEGPGSVQCRGRGVCAFGVSLKRVCRAPNAWG
jgi:hypothetical protein